jgi:alanine racemase
MKRRNFIKTVGASSLIPVSGLKLDELSGQKIPSAPESETPGSMDPRIEVNLGNIVWNFSQIKKRVKVPVMSVVKANAYGHGLVETSRALERAGTDWLMVGKLQEGIELRRAGIRCPILNFGPFGREDCEDIIARDISQSVFTEDVRFLDETASRLNKKASIHIDIDTGMSRTGIPFNNALPLFEKIAALPRIKIAGVSTTLTEDPEFDREQVRRFLAVCVDAKKKGISLGLRHAASSAGIFQGQELYLDMVRPGITLYGYYPNAQTQSEDALNLKPALKISAKVTFIKDLFPGDSLSYHRVYKATERMRVATVGIGYSDGYPPALAGKGFVSIRGKKFPVLPAVTANHSMVDLQNDRDVRVGDAVTLIDKQKNSGLTADMLAELSSVSDYKILIGLNPLIPRWYLCGSDIGNNQEA